jgi:hypothetical protein
MISRRLYRLAALAFVVCLHASTEASLVACKETLECQAALGPGSMCVDDVCTNPYYNGGCLKNILPDWKRIRVCNSQDPPDAEAMGYCRKSPMDYAEIRIAGLPWESPNFITWILQILLSEVLEVPTSLESGIPDFSLNLYEMNSRFDFWNSVISGANGWAETKLATQVGDCLAVASTQDPSSYQPCFHVHPEVWVDEWPAPEGVEPFRDLGLSGGVSMRIPKFAIAQDPSLATYMGLQGEKNRRKVAETFKRPTRWGQFCREVSPSNCSKPDPIAERAPSSEEEEASFFHDGAYTGYFRQTEEGNCDKHPTNCTGHFGDYPCGYLSFAQPQSYHYNIPFAFEGPEPHGGYPITELAQIWSAANATKSPAAIFYWTPTAMVESYIGTDAEFVKVQFPAATQECADSRIPLGNQCDMSLTFEERMGDPVGACGKLMMAYFKRNCSGFLLISNRLCSSAITQKLTQRP